MLCRGEGSFEFYFSIIKILVLVTKFKLWETNMLFSFNFCIQAYHQYGVGSTPAFVNHKKGALDSQPQVIEFTSRLAMIGGSLRVLRLLPPLKLVATI
jgi:hypothetical protein